MTDLYHQFADNRGAFERLLERIPGFRGYLDKNDRRAADRAVRDYVADAVTRRIQRLNQIEKALLDGGGLSYMSKTTNVKAKLQTYHDRIKAAAPGYSGFMDAVRVDELALERLYNFDEAQILYADRFDKALDAFDSAVQSQQGIDEAIAALDALAVEANNAYSLRESVLTDLNDNLPK